MKTPHLEGQISELEHIKNQGFLTPKGEGMLTEFKAIKELLSSKESEEDNRISLPHESQIDVALDKLLVIRGEHPTRVRNPLYGEERQLAKDLVKYVLLNT